jgi:hypothetical protein
MSTKIDELIGTGLRALVAHDAGLRTRLRLDLQTQNTTKSRGYRAAFLWILEGERRLRRVSEGNPEALQKVNQKDGSEKFT